MCLKITSKNIGRILLATVVATIIAQVIHTLGATLAMSYYTDPQYFAVWSKIMMPKAGPPPASFMYLSLLFSLITYLIFVVFYNYFQGSIKTENNLLRGLYYGIIIFLMMGIGGMMSLFLLINLPLALIAYWTIEGLVIFLLAGLIAGLIVKPK